MPHSAFEDEFHSLRVMRRRLTVAMLAVEQVCRKFVSAPPAKRLCSFATEALKALRGEIAMLETRLLRREQAVRPSALPPEQRIEHTADE